MEPEKDTFNCTGCGESYKRDLNLQPGEKVEIVKSCHFALVEPSQIGTVTGRLVSVNGITQIEVTMDKKRPWETWLFLDSSHELKRI